jgi:predicted Holliday junction resolvase-like endonuclease
MDRLPPLLLLSLGIVGGALFGSLVMWIRDRLAFRSAIVTASRRSVDQSRRTLKGQIAEQMAPLLPGFPYEPGDARFLGDPIDYVVFNGYTDVKDGQAGPDQIEIVILDVKRGTSKLSPMQRAIARAIEQGRVKFEVVRIADDGVARAKAVGSAVGSSRVPR